MKKIRLWALGMAAIMAISGCGASASQEETTSSVNNGNDSDVSGTGASYAVSTTKQALEGEEIDAYRTFLTEKLDTTGGGFTAALLHLNEDDAYELAIVDDPSIENCGAQLFTYADGEVKSLATEGFQFYGQYGNFSYYDKKSFFFYDREQAGADSVWLYEYIFKADEDEVYLDLELALCTEFETSETTYFINGDEATKEDVEKLGDKYNVNDGDGYITFNPGIATTINTGVDIEAALSEDYSAIYYKDQAQQVPCLKPAIYLYPEEDGTEVSVELSIDGYFTDTDPAFNEDNGWTVTADSDGTIHLGDESFDYLFWEAMLQSTYTFHDGFCVAGAETESFLTTMLPQLGLNEKETEEFVAYWLPKMEGNKYNIIRFQTDEYTDHSELKISPEPDTVIRVFMTYYGCENYINISRQEIETPERKGFTVVEWGGSEVG